VSYLRSQPVDGRQLITPELDLAITAYRKQYGAT
jgi:hypothetical protein